jgi:hypothetical protein
MPAITRINKMMCIFFICGQFICHLLPQIMRSIGSGVSENGEAKIEQKSSLKV